MAVLLISASKLKQESVINGNVDDSLVNPSILDAQEIHIRPCIGSDLYKKILLLVSNNTISDAGNSTYKTLLDDYIIPALVKWCEYEISPNLLFRFTNKTLGTKTGDNTTSISMSDMFKLQELIEDKAEVRTNRIRAYLNENASATVFPEYYSPGTGCDVIKPDKSTWTSSIYLG